MWPDGAMDTVGSEVSRFSNCSAVMSLTSTASPMRSPSSSTASCPLIGSGTKPPCCARVSSPSSVLPPDVSSPASSSGSVACSSGLVATGSSDEPEKTPVARTTPPITASATTTASANSNGLRRDSGDWSVIVLLLRLRRTDDRTHLPPQRFPRSSMLWGGQPVLPAPDPTGHRSVPTASRSGDVGATTTREQDGRTTQCQQYGCDSNEPSGVGTRVRVVVVTVVAASVVAVVTAVVAASVVLGEVDGEVHDVGRGRLDVVDDLASTHPVLTLVQLVLRSPLPTTLVVGRGGSGLLTVDIDDDVGPWVGVAGE